jgi:hypothetical protein
MWVYLSLLVLQQKLSLPALFFSLIHHFFIFSICASLFPSFAMTVNPSMAAPFASKNLGDLSKNNPVVKELLTAILKAVEHVVAHKVTGWSKGKVFFRYPFIILFYCRLFFFFFFFLFSRHGLRLLICFLSEGQHVSSTSGRRRFMTSRTRWCQ